MEEHREVGERELVDLARRDPAAFAELYRRHVQAVHAFARRRTGSAEEAEDITALTFERALRSLARYRPDRGSFIAWLYRISTNAIIDHARRQQRQRTPRGQAALQLLSDQPTTGPDHDGSDPVLLAALNTLPDRYNTVLSLRFIAGLEPAEVAAHLGITTGNCAVLTHRALAVLRSRLDRGETP